MDLNKLSSAFVQIVYLTIDPEHNLKDESTESGATWSRALDVVERSTACQRLHWGRSVEQPDKVQLHIVRARSSQHKVSLQEVFDVLQPILKPGFTTPQVRHVASMNIFTSTPTTAFDAPVTGTAVYVDTTSAWHEGSWPCWTHIVRHIKGNSGIVGGRLLEDVDAQDTKAFAGMSSAIDPGAGRTKFENCYLVYVGWDSIKDHNDYHHTQHFKDHGVVLRIGNSGWREYGHIKFEGWRYARPSANL